MRLNNFQQIHDEVQKFGDSIMDSIRRPEPKLLLGFALDLLRPHLQSLGFRVARLSAERTEIVIPNKVLSHIAHSGIDEGIMCTAAVYGLRLLWSRASPQIPTLLSVQKLDFERINEATGPLRLRLQLSKAMREGLFVELLQNKEARLELTAQVFDSHDQMVTKIQMICRLQQRDALEWK